MVSLWVSRDQSQQAAVNLKTTVPFDISKRTKPDYQLLKAGFWGFSEGVSMKL
jgi:hypothetical protein